MSRKTIVDRLRSVHALTLRKHGLDQKRLSSKMKTAGSVVSLAPSVQVHHRIRPAWMMRRDTVHGFDNAVPAVSFMMSSLQLQPK